MFILFLEFLRFSSGEIPPELYKKLNFLADEYGQGDLRATTRQGKDCPNALLNFTLRVFSLATAWNTERGS